MPASYARVVQRVVFLLLVAGTLLTDCVFVSIRTPHHGAWTPAGVREPKHPPIGLAAIDPSASSIPAAPRCSGRATCGEAHHE